MDTSIHNPDSKSSGGIFTRLKKAADGGYVDQLACDHAFERMHRLDSIGDRIYLILACLGLMVFFGPVTVSELAFAPLVVFFIVRVVNTFPVWIHGFGQPIVLAVIVLMGWMMLSLLWSGDRPHGWSEIGELRWFLLVGFFFPIIEHRVVLIRALCIGLAIGQLGQVADAFNGFGIGWLESLVENHPGRIGGWWHPVVGGTMLVGGLGLHLPAALFGTGRARIFGILGSGMISLGILATGSRGAWIASVLLVLFCVGFGLIARWIRWKRVFLIAAIGSVVLGAGAFTIREGLQSRINETRVELNEIMDGQYDSYTGKRIRMGKVAIEGIKEHPIIGVGAGNFQHWGNDHDPDQGIFAHAHNGLLHIWSTLGLVGVLVWSVVLGIMLRSAWRFREVDRAQISDHIYSVGPFFAICGLMLATITDVVHINTQSAAMLGILAGLSPSICPGHRDWSGIEQGWQADK